MSTLTVVVANIKSVPRMDAGDVDDDIEALFDLARKKHADAVFGAEIAFKDYRRSWREHAEKAGYRSRGAKRECPIAIRGARPPKTSPLPIVEQPARSRAPKAPKSPKGAP